RKPVTSIVRPPVPRRPSAPRKLDSENRPPPTDAQRSNAPGSTWFDRVGVQGTSILSINQAGKPEKPQLSWRADRKLLILRGKLGTGCNSLLCRKESK